MKKALSILTLVSAIGFLAQIEAAATLVSKNGDNCCCSDPSGKSICKISRPDSCGCDLSERPTQPKTLDLTIGAVEKFSFFSTDISQSLQSIPLEIKAVAEIAAHIAYSSHTHSPPHLRAPPITTSIAA